MPNLENFPFNIPPPEYFDRRSKRLVRDHCRFPFVPPAFRNRHSFLRLLSLLLLIYAALGRGGAHIGVRLSGETGIFIGDLALFFGLAVSTVEGSWHRFFVLPVAWPWFLFFGWHAAQTLPYLSIYGLVALRDGVTWGYSLFAVIVGSQLIAHPSGFAFLLNNYAKFARFYVFFVLIITPVSILNYDFSQNWLQGVLATIGFDPPTSEGLLVLVATTAGFVVCGFVSVPVWWWWAFAIEFVAIGSQGRGALMACLAAAGVLWLLTHGPDGPTRGSSGCLGGLV